MELGEVIFIVTSIIIAPAIAFGLLYLVIDIIIFQNRIDSFIISLLIFIFVVSIAVYIVITPEERD